MSNCRSLKRELGNASGRSPLCISALMGANLDQLLDVVWKELGIH